MKNTLRYILNVITLVAILAITGCEDELKPSANIESISTESIFQGEVVSMTGQGFENIQFLFLGLEQLEYTLEGNTISFTVPEDFPVGMTNITLAMTGGIRETHAFEVLLKPTPVVGAFTPFVPVGSDITITGTSLDNNTSVTVDGVPATIVSVSDTELVVTVPDGVNENAPISFEVTTDYGVAAPPTAFYAKENLLKNSQLNEGEGANFTDWESVNLLDGSQISEVTGDAAYGGSGRSMRVLGAGAGAGSQWRTQIGSSFTPLTFGETYTVVLWAKAEAAGASMRVSVSQYDGNGADYFYGADQEISTVWQQYTWTFEVTNDLPEHRVMLDMGLTNIPFVIDHVALVPGTVGSGLAPDIMVDGGFENGLPGDNSGWTVLNGNITVSDDALCGTNSVMAVGAGGNAWDTQMASAPLSLEFEGTYEVSFWAKAAGADGVVSVSVSRYTDGSEPKSDYFYSHQITVAEDWTQYSYVFTVATDLPEGHNIVFDLGRTTQTFFIDEVTIREYEAPESLLADPGFENGLPGDDTGWTVLNGDITVTTDAANVFDGTNAVQAVGAGGNAWDTQMASEPIPLTVGKRYSVKFKAKAAGADGIISISVSRYTDGSEPKSDYYYSHQVVIAEEWTTYTFNFEALTELPDGHNIVFDMGRTTQTFFIDDVVVYELPDFECGD